MKFLYVFKWNFYSLFYNSSLYYAIENENVEIVKLLLSHDEIDVNNFNIFNDGFYTILKLIH